MIIESPLAFGNLDGHPQPSSKHFSNLLFDKLRKIDAWGENPVNGVVCDTAHMELRMWSRVKFGLDIEIEPETPIDQIFLCQTIEEFEEDPLRQLPDYMERVEYEKEFLDFLKEEGMRYKVLEPEDLEDRKKIVVARVKRLLNG